MMLGVPEALKPSDGQQLSEEILHAIVVSGGQLDHQQATTRFELGRSTVGYRV
ncbi:hypothetical protein AERO9AM_11079 [Aeromicrobium sp. 9AM]|nr:hypothetical protein AERO9AM_11079 [Aeromicrobium sp. 9AM]